MRPPVATAAGVSALHPSATIATRSRRTRLGMCDVLDSTVSARQSSTASSIGSHCLSCVHRDAAVPPSATGSTVFDAGGCRMSLNVSHTSSHTACKRAPTVSTQTSQTYFPEWQMPRRPPHPGDGRAMHTAPHHAARSAHASRPA